jgi:hypothetical protein
MLFVFLLCVIYLFRRWPICGLFHDVVSPVDYILTSNDGVTAELITGSYIEWRDHVLKRRTVAAFTWND